MVTCLGRVSFLVELKEVRRQVELVAAEPADDVDVAGSFAGLATSRQWVANESGGARADSTWKTVRIVLSETCFWF